MRIATAVVASLVLAPALGLALGSAPARAEAGSGRPTLDRIPEVLPPGSVMHAVNTHKIYLNRCVGGCQVTTGSTDARTDHSSIASTGQLSAFSRSDTVWNNVVACVKDTFARTGADIDIVTVDPGTEPHFEIMFGGTPTELGFDPNTGGVSPWSCQGSYIPNSLVFVFDVWGNSVEDNCSTAAQEIAHSWKLDHLAKPSDPLTYFQYSGRRYFTNGPVQCGSDCVSGLSPFGKTCTGGTQQLHACDCTGQQTQDPIAIMKSLFGTGVPTPPIANLLAPANGASVEPGFPVQADLTDESTVALGELLIDGVVTSSKPNQPWAFNAPADLAPGAHTVQVRATDDFGAAATTAMVTVTIGSPCEKPADCPLDTDTCIGSRCVPGPGVQGGLGSTCAVGTECASGVCAGDSSDHHYCVTSCAVGGTDCPTDFKCLAGGASGVCWPDPAATDGGGCETGSGGGAAPILLGGAFAALVLGRRRRR